MRAKISDRKGFSVDAMRQDPFEALGRYALMEAQAILGETQGMPEGYQWANRCYLGALDSEWCIPESKAILSEALQGFLKMEF